MIFVFSTLDLVDVVEEKKQSSCSMQLTNTTDQSVAFKVRFGFGRFCMFVLCWMK